MLESFSFELLSDAVEIFFLDPHLHVELTVEFFDFCDFLFLNLLLFLKPFQQLSFLLSLDFQVIGLGSQFFEASIEGFSSVFGEALLTFCLIELCLNHFQLILLILFFFLLAFHFDLLLLFLLGQGLKSVFKVLLLCIDGIYPVTNFLKFSFVGVETDLQDLLLLFQLFVGDGVLVNRGNLSLRDRVILLH